MQGWWAASYLVLWALVIVLSLVVVAVARQLGNMRSSPGMRLSTPASDGPPLGEPLPALEVTALDGRPVTIGGSGPRQLLLFVSLGCGVCEQLLPALTAVARTAQVATCVLTDADPVEARREFHAGSPVVSAPELLQRWNVVSTPFAVALDRLGVVEAKGPVASVEQLEALAASRTGHS